MLIELLGAGGGSRVNSVHLIPLKNPSCATDDED
jgi:hypothetical protein